MKINIQLLGGRGASSGMYIKYTYRHLPKDPKDLVRNGWKDVTDDRNKGNSKEFYNPKTKDKVRFDKGQRGKNGYRGKNHYHWYNPNYKNDGFKYLDKNGNPTRKNNKNSHLFP